ncbi:MAG: aspartate carbamoyltransferase regulatory subunit [Oscillospiraceae bacterium]|nr:aspartate carbamoyltransferase regulatory subunit [Oscillospiraceae bacterium]
MKGQRLVNSIEKGIVIDHIRAGLGVKLFHFLKLDNADFTVVIISGAESKRMGRKDIIKIQNMIDIDYTVIGLIDHNATISIIEDGEITEKKKLELPRRVENVIVCKNPRCITSTERQIPHVFSLQNAETRTYRCDYCEDHVRGIEI